MRSESPQNDLNVVAGFGGGPLSQHRGRIGVQKALSRRGCLTAASAARTAQWIEDDEEEVRLSQAFRDVNLACTIWLKGRGLYYDGDFWAVQRRARLAAADAASPAGSDEGRAS